MLRDAGEEAQLTGSDDDLEHLNSLAQSALDSAQPFAGSASRNA